ncbi:MAG: ferritin-like domain-containing protein [Proteobacteria bacterium]|nr:ferritin-like domain-containing protein [Pseudomonadota bacterium]
MSDFARRLIEAETLAGKLEPPPRRLTCDENVTAIRLTAPGRPDNLTILAARQVKVPPPVGMADPAQRVRILHALANHELQAAELFAWALLAFPDAPGPFRRGLVAILADEQRHCRLYIECLAALGARFGDYPVTGHFWNKIAGLTTPLQFVCTMGLTFENANLDFAKEYARAAQDAGDERTATALDQVHADEIRHVRFAWRWLNQLSNPLEGAWDTYLASVRWPLGPARARGKQFDRTSRRAAGLADDFIRKLEATAPKRPGGAPR